MTTPTRPVPRTALQRILAGLADVPVEEWTEGRADPDQVRRLNDTAERLHRLLTDNGAQLTLANTEVAPNVIDTILHAAYRLQSAAEMVLSADSTQQLYDRYDILSERIQEMDDDVQTALQLTDDDLVSLRLRMRR